MNFSCVEHYIKQKDINKKCAIFVNQKWNKKYDFPYIYISTCSCVEHKKAESLIGTAGLGDARHKQHVPNCVPHPCVTWAMAPPAAAPGQADRTLLPWPAYVSAGPGTAMIAVPLLLALVTVLIPSPSFHLVFFSFVFILNFELGDNVRDAPPVTCRLEIRVTCGWSVSWLPRCTVHVCAECSRYSTPASFLTVVSAQGDS